MNFSETLRAKRAAAKLTVSQLARKSGLSRQHIHALERGSLPGLAALRKLARALKCTIDELGGDE